MSELRLNTDGHIIKLGADNDVTLTHVADTGILLNSTMQLQFNDSSQFINAPSATVLDINATDEIELNATAVDLNGTLDVSGTLTQTGVATFSARSVHSSGITIADAGQIGSASDADAIAIASNGVVTFSQNPVFPDGGVAVADLDIDGATDIGAAVVDADLFIIDDGAGGTNRKVTASRIKTYAGYDGAISTLDIDGGTDIGAALVDADEIIVDDGGGGTNRRCDMSRVKTYVGGDSTPLFAAFHNAAQTISNDTLTQVAFNTESTASGGAAGIDSDSKFASNAFQPTVAGYYFIKFQTTFAVTDNEAISVHIRRNGGVAIKLECTSSSSGSQTNGFQISGMIYLDSDDSTDIAVYCTSDDVGLNGLASGSIVITMFQGWRLTGV
jgi:hypothetical protein